MKNQKDLINQKDLMNRKGNNNVYMHIKVIQKFCEFYRLIFTKILHVIHRPNYDDRYRPTQSWERPTTTPPPTRRPLGAISVRINSPRNRFQLNSQISLPCTVNSYSQPNVYWSKDGRRLSDTRKTQVTNACFDCMNIRNHVMNSAKINKHHNDFF